MAAHLRIPAINQGPRWFINRHGGVTHLRNVYGDSRYARGESSSSSEENQRQQTGVISGLPDLGPFPFNETFTSSAR